MAAGARGFEHGSQRSRATQESVERRLSSIPDTCNVPRSPLIPFAELSSCTCIMALLFWVQCSLVLASSMASILRVDKSNHVYQRLSVEVTEQVPRHLCQDTLNNLEVSNFVSQRSLFFPAAMLCWQQIFTLIIILSYIMVWLENDHHFLCDFLHIAQ